MTGLQPTKKQITICGSNVHCWIFNDDKPTTIVMVHGFRGTHHGLYNIIAGLPQFRIVIPDLPGFGESTPMTQRPHTIAGYSEFVKRFIRHVAPGQPVLLGHSFGSIVAAHTAATEPELITKLILVNPIAVSPLKGPRVILTQLAVFYYWLGRALPERAGRALLANPLIVLATSALLAKTKDKQLRKVIHKSHLTHFSSFQNRRVLNEAFRTSIRHTVSDYANDIPMPTLLIAGEADDIAPIKGQLSLNKQLDHATLLTIPRVGHLVHHEAPQQAARAIKQFLR